MRTLWLILGTIGAIVVIAGIYVLVQPTPPPPPSIAKELTEKAQRLDEPTDSATVIHGGEDVWVTVPDPQTMQTAWQFRVARYDPQPDGTVNVTKPQAEFFFSGGQIVGIAGTHGRVVVPAEATRRTDLRGPTAPPTRGELYDVTVTLRNESNPEHPVLVCKLNNIAFDNDLFRIAAESYTDAAGKVIPADQVPVEIRGDDYDFDGRGLEIRWNERDRRLAALEIAHSESLRVKAFRADKMRVSSAVSTGAAQPTARPATRPAAEAKPAVAGAPATAESNEPVYRATFNGGVKITQGQHSIATAEIMHVDFMVGDTDEPAASTKPVSTTAPATRRAPRQPATGAVTSPAAEPIMIRWPGKLVVVPVEADPPALLPGQQSVQMASREKPVELNYAGSEIRCASFVYRSDDDLVISSSPQLPAISLKDASGALLHAASLHYSGAMSKAEIQGTSRIEVPLHNSQTDSADLLTAQWNKRCLLTLGSDAAGNVRVEHADVTGDVDVDHSRVKLRAQSLQVAFAPSADGKSNDVQVKELVADGSVNCQLVSAQSAAGAKPRHITADHLVLTAAQGEGGQLVPQSFKADGNVHTFDAEQDLKAGHLSATFAPLTRENDQPQLQNLFAQQDVRFAFKDAAGRCDQLEATPRGEDYDLKLSGQPTAQVTMRRSTLAGPIINLQPKAQRMRVIGAGSLHGEREAPGEPPMPYRLTWDRGLEFDGNSNHAEASGAVTVSAAMTDGSTSTAIGQRLTVDLIDQPRPATKPAARATGGAAEMDSLSGKAIKTLVLDGGVELRSILPDPEGVPLRRVHLFAPLVRVEGEAGRVVIPSAGRMLYEDRRERKPTTQPGPGLGELGGATAFEWQRELVYDQNNNRAEMLGMVVIVHEGADGKAAPFRLDSSHVIAEFLPQRRAASEPSDANLKRLTAGGGVRFTSRKIRFDGDRMVYDPLSSWLDAYGSDRIPVDVFDETGISTGSFRQIGWNTRTGDIRLRDIHLQIRR